MQVTANRTIQRNKIHPQKFALYAGCVSIFMMFMAWTSAYIVRQAAGNWLEFQIPNIFFYSTAIIILSSLTLQFSYIFFKKENFGLYKILLILTFVLGVIFLMTQYQGWQVLNSALGIPLGENPSSDFLYVISGAHAAHIVGGLGVLFTATAHAFGLKNQVTSKRLLRFELTYTYWHFVGVLWVYLILFFHFQR